MFDLLRLGDFFDAATCEEILAQLRDRGAEPAAVYGSGAGAAVQPRVRSARSVDASPALRDLVTGRLLVRKPEIEKHFDITLGACEDPQFLRYQTGDSFVAHQDGNTLPFDDSRDRRISIVVFLNAGYGGGALTFHGSYPDHYHVRYPFIGPPGTLVAFRSQTTHEVVPVTHGERYTIVSWFSSG